MKDSKFVVLGALLGGLAVAEGAFGAHGLRKVLSAEMLAVFETGVRYQMYHALALLATGLLKEKNNNPLLETAGWLFVWGTVLFSGSLLILAMTEIRWLGAITPLGGVAYLVAWLCLAWGCWRLR